MNARLSTGKGALINGNLFILRFFGTAEPLKNQNDKKYTRKIKKSLDYCINVWYNYIELFLTRKQQGRR